MTCFQPMIVQCFWRWHNISKRWRTLGKAVQNVQILLNEQQNTAVYHADDVCACMLRSCICEGAKVTLFEIQNSSTRLSQQTYQQRFYQYNSEQTFILPKVPFQRSFLGASRSSFAVCQTSDINQSIKSCPHTKHLLHKSSVINMTKCISHWQQFNKVTILYKEA